MNRIKHFTLSKNIIGKGSYSTVYKGTDIRSKQIVAIKYIYINKTICFTSCNLHRFCGWAFNVAQALLFLLRVVSNLIRDRHFAYVYFLYHM